MTRTGRAAACTDTARFRMRPLALCAALALVAGCHTDRLRPAEDGFEIRSRATPERAYEAAVAVARELGHPARQRDGAVEVELPQGPPMSERPSRWLRVTVTPRGRGTVTTVRALPTVSVRPRTPRERTPVGMEAYAYADLLADRLAEGS